MRVTLAALTASLCLPAGVQPAAAETDTATSDGAQPLSLAVTNGRAYFYECAGTCSLNDALPSKTGPVRSWQTITLTEQGLRVRYKDNGGQAPRYLGKYLVCFNVTPALVEAAGGAEHLKIAYWDSRLKYCDKDGCGRGRWYVLKTTFHEVEACALLRLAATFALVIER